MSTMAPLLSSLEADNSSMPILTRGIPPFCKGCTISPLPSAFLKRKRSSRNDRRCTSRSSRRSLSSQFLGILVEQPPSLGQPVHGSRRKCEASPWQTLGVEPSEFSTALTLPTGQSFLWKQTGSSEFTGVVASYIFSLRQGNAGIEFLLHHGKDRKLDSQEAENCLRDYLNLDISLKDMWNTFIASDARFAALAPYLAGARILRQHPVECLFQFICSSNNNIQRISSMVDYLARLGPYLGTVNDMAFHAFPSLDQLASVTENQLREAGFGYRAKYIVGAVKELRLKKGGGEEWLFSLRSQAFEHVRESLCTIPGIGPKVAACIALFSLDQHHAIPVDTHVWQIATKYLIPELAGERLYPKLHDTVSKAFVQKFGKYAGWAHTVLFIAELPSHQMFLPEHLRVARTKEKPRKSRIKTSRKAQE